MTSFHHYTNLVCVGNYWWPQTNKNYPCFFRVGLNSHQWPGFCLALLYKRGDLFVYVRQFCSSSTILKGHQFMRNSPARCHKVATQSLTYPLPKVKWLPFTMYHAISFFGVGWLLFLVLWKCCLSVTLQFSWSQKSNCFGFSTLISRVTFRPKPLWLSTDYQELCCVKKTWFSSSKLLSSDHITSKNSPVC